MTDETSPPSTDGATPAAGASGAGGRSTGGGFGWPHAVAVLAVVLLLGVLGVTFMVLSTASKATEVVAGSGRVVLEQLEDIAAAFQTGTVTTSFRSYATEVSGNTFLQFSTLDQLEQFERSEKASLLWGKVDLPDVVVQATAPVQYTYYLDFNDEWLFELEGDVVRVIAPRIRFNKPAIDASELEWQVKEGSLFRDEEPVREKLRLALSQMAEKRARDNVGLVREIGRRRTETFVENWLFRAFGERSEELHVDIVFRDEASPFPDAGLPSGLRDPDRERGNDS